MALTHFCLITKEEKHWWHNFIKMKAYHFKHFRYFTTNITIGLSTLCGLLATLSCSTTKTIALSCQERQIEIYVDGEYLGRDLVYYTVPKNKEYIEVSCKDNDMEVYHRRINVRDKNGNLIELQIPKNYRYSSKPY